ncbi:MAG: DNA methyltransferase [Ignavibacteriales bacterium]|nr:MAG: DNA methyltransferase [Ignavibacteriales bacterium]
MLKNYLKQITTLYNKDEAREESYYDFLKVLLTDFSDQHRKRKINVTILPKATEAGNPDFKVNDGHWNQIGYIEAKTIGTDLNKIEDSEQLERYISTFPNVMVTNFTEFRFYRDGKFVDKVEIAHSKNITKLGAVPPELNEDKFYELLNNFLDYSIPKKFNAKSLATELAKRTRFLKDQVVAQELKANNKDIQSFHNAFKEFLIAGIDEDEFADLYSQTITYGLFAARLRADKKFNRKLAYDYIPKSIGILRDVFRFISSTDIPDQMISIVDDISEVLEVADTKKILEEYFVQGKGKDPVLHFYETFLEVYDPKTREKRGVYYTPEPVVSFIVRSLHQILKNEFGIAEGLAGDNVTLLDPAGGTLSFLAQAIQKAVEEKEEKYGKGVVKDFIRKTILNNYHAFELMMAPYAIGHMKMSFLLEELGYKLADDERVKYYLTNTLDMEELEEAKFPGMTSISHESHEAGKVKKQVPILVVLGNPPYSGHSSNTGGWISSEIKEYYKVDGKPLGEKNPKWLQDDYVKFIRFAQWKIDQAGTGVLGFITNHSYLDNPTFRGMRQSLMNSFDEIYILDLHGNSLKKEKTPDGGKDENVFDIRQGVAIAFFIKKEKKKKKVLHSEIYGTREKKYDWLEKKNINSVKWKELKPQSEFYLFINTNNEHQYIYRSFKKITEIFPINNTGIVTKRDSFVIDFETIRLRNRINVFLDSKNNDDFISQSLSLRMKDKDRWDLKNARKSAQKIENPEDFYTKINYRPFDHRSIFYNETVIARPVFDVMRHMFGYDNIALITERRVRGDKFHHCFVTKAISDLHSIDMLGGGNIFPLYLYPDTTKEDLFSGSASGEKEPNIAPEIFEKLNKQYKITPPSRRGAEGGEVEEITPEQIFYYIYAVLYSNTYRTKYAEFLKIDFPRIPFTKDYKLFIKLGELGKELADLHLLKSKKLNKPIAKFDVDGSNEVEKVTYEKVGTTHELSLKGRVFINKEQYFEPVTEEVWNYHIGGYQVCHKWLKDRKGRTLTLEERETYCKIVTALYHTIEIQKQIDELYVGVEG